MTDKNSLRQSLEGMVRTAVEAAVDFVRRNHDAQATLTSPSLSLGINIEQVEEGQLQASTPDGFDDPPHAPTLRLRIAAAHHTVLSDCVTSYILAVLTNPRFTSIRLIRRVASGQRLPVLYINSRRVNLQEEPEHNLV